MSIQAPDSLIVNSWTIYAHPLFLDQLESLIAQVESLRGKDPRDYMQKNAAKRLAAIVKLAFEIIPQDPHRPEYRQGNTLGADRRHWFRAKFFQQYRLFFRFHHKSRIIVYVWVNDEKTKRAYESKHDAYRVFQKMLETRHPPDDWESLLNQAKSNVQRLHASLKGSKPDQETHEMAQKGRQDQNIPPTDHTD